MSHVLKSQNIYYSISPMFFETHTISHMRTPYCCPTEKELLWFIKKKDYIDQQMSGFYSVKIRLKKKQHIKSIHYITECMPQHLGKCAFVWVQSLSASRAVSYSRGHFGTQVQRALCPCVYLSKFRNLLPTVCLILPFLCFNMKFRIFCALLTEQESRNFISVLIYSK